MIIVKVNQSKKGFRLYIANANGEITNHFYNQKSDAKKAWKNFEKQIMMGKIKFVE